MGVPPDAHAKPRRRTRRSPKNLRNRSSRTRRVIPHGGSLSKLSKQLHHLLRDLRADAAFFVFEVDKDVFPIRLLLADELRPVFDVLLLIIFATKTEVAVIRGDFFRSGEVVSVGDAQRNVS